MAKHHVYTKLEAEVKGFTNKLAQATHAIVELIEQAIAPMCPTCKKRRNNTPNPCEHCGEVDL